MPCEKKPYYWCYYLMPAFVPAVVGLWCVLVGVYVVLSVLWLGNVDSIFSIGLLPGVVALFMLLSLCAVGERIRSGHWRDLPDGSLGLKILVAAILPGAIFVLASSLVFWPCKMGPKEYGWIINGQYHYSDTAFAVPFYDHIDWFLKVAPLPEPYTILVSGVTKDKVRVSGLLSVVVQFTNDEARLIEIVQRDGREEIVGELYAILAREAAAAIFQFNCSELANTLAVDAQISKRISSQALAKQDLVWSGYVKTDSWHVGPP